MKKFLIVLIILSFSTSGCFLKQPQEKPQVEKKANNQEVKEEPKSLSDWFDSGEGVECVIESEEGEAKVYSMKDNVYMEGKGFNYENPDEVGHLLSDGSTTYMWVGKQGTKMELQEMSDQTRETQRQSVEDWRESIKNWDNAEVPFDCQKGGFSDEIFEVPEDVEFRDLNAMLEANQNMIDEMGERFDEGNPGQIDMEDMQKMIEDMNSGM